MIIKVKPIPNEYDCIQFIGSNVNECLIFIGEQQTKTNPYWGLFKIGQVNAEVGDYIIRTKGRAYVVPKQAFEEEWEKVNK